MNIDFHLITRKIVLDFELTDLSLEQRRAIFNHLLMDHEVNPGQDTMSPEKRDEFVAMLQRWCSWPHVR